MLLRKHCSRSEKRGLLSVHRRDERGAHGDLCLAITGITADEAVHRLCGRKIALHILDCRRLIGCFVIWERRLKGRDTILFDIVCKARNDSTSRLRLKERGGKIGDRALRVALFLRPATPVQTVKLHLLALYANIARKEMRMGNRHMKLRSIRIFDGEHLAACFANLYFRGTEKASDAMIKMNDKLARLDIHRLTKAFPGTGGSLSATPSDNLPSLRTRNAVRTRCNHQSG